MTVVLALVWLSVLPLTTASAATSDAFEPDSRLDMATIVPGDTPLARAIDPANDADWLRLDVRAGHSYVLDVTPGTEDPWTDLVMGVYVAGSTSAFASDDDAGTNLMPHLVLTATANETWHIRVAGCTEWTTGTYSIDVRDISAASLTGTATGVGNVPMGYILVKAYALGSSAWTEVGSTYTDADGVYQFTLEAGTYRLSAEQPSTGQSPLYFPSATTVADASDIVLVEGQTTTLPAISAVRWSYVHGTVTDTSGQPAGGISVAAYKNVGGIWKAATWTVTGADGSWRMALAENTYKFGFTDPSGALLPAFYDGADSLDAASAVTAATSTPTLVTSLEPMGASARTLPSDSNPSVHTIAGDNRYETAVKISREAFPEGADALIVVTGASWPDGLGAASLAGALEAPILLVKPDSIPAVVAAEIERLGATHAIIVGGANAVGPSVEQDLQSLVGAGAIQRFGGHDRYETARLVADETLRVLDVAGTPWDGTYILASGLSFPDVLAASPLSAAQGWPVLLTKRDALPGATHAFLTGHPEAAALVVGGTAVVADATLRSVSSTGRTPTRVYGSDRYETALRIAEYATRNDLLGYTRLAIATGQDFPDALTCSALQAESGSVLLLTPGSRVDRRLASTLDSLPTEDCERITFVGGASAISPGVKGELTAQLEK